MRCSLTALALLLATATPLAAQAVSDTQVASDAQVELLPHRGVYDLALVGGSANIDDARGRIVFEFAGDSCEGYVTTVRQVTTLSGAGSSQTLDMNSTSFEEADGSSLRFRSETRADGVRIKQVDGNARNEDGQMLLDLRQPEAASTTFPQQPAFPVAHLKAIMRAAAQGTPTLAMTVFDGSDDGTQFYETLAIVGKELPPRGDDAFPAIAQTAQWPVTLRYFEQSDDQGEQTPAYV
ncbi:MAG TPA: DUF1849 family protein, partial [Saliniramus sp.]|nr:DUF1849 family protein [Saliniramus sp.]